MNLKKELDLMLDEKIEEMERNGENFLLFFNLKDDNFYVKSESDFYIPTTSIVSLSQLKNKDREMFIDVLISNLSDLNTSNQLLFHYTADVDDLVEDIPYHKILKLTKDGEKLIDPKNFLTREDFFKAASYNNISNNTKDILKIESYMKDDQLFLNKLKEIENQINIVLENDDKEAFLLLSKQYKYLKSEI